MRPALRQKSAHALCSLLSSMMLPALLSVAHAQDIAPDMLHAQPSWSLSSPVTGSDPTRSVRTMRVLPDDSDARPAPASGVGHFVQITVQRNEATALAAFEDLRAKYSSVLGSRQPVIRRADLGSRGIHHRVLVGPFDTAEQASRICARLKDAGGQCLTTRD
jgi:SPOR domain